MKLFVKRVISVALAACMAIGSAAALSAEKIGDLTASFAVKAAAATIVDSGKCGDNVTYTLYSDGLLTISGVGIMYEYSRVQLGEPYISPTPWGNKKFTRAVISDGVTSIGNYAFYGCHSLKRITIPSGVTRIGDYAFENCSSLTSITIPDSVTSIGGAAFSGCRSLTSITIPDGVTSIYNGAFYDCSSLTNITIPDGVTSIGASAFYCTGLTSVTIPDSVTSIDYAAFSDCSSLTSVTIGSGVTSIGNHAFFECSSLKSVTIGNSVTSIGNYAFSGCSSLTSITIPNSVKSIGYSAFSWCTGLTSITIPNSVKSIGYSAFSWCTGLTSITIPDSVTSIGNYAFRGCTGLTSIAIPDSVTNIGESAFYGCTGLTSIAIPDSVTNIGESAFYGCTGLTSITIPDGVTSIGNYAFFGCSSLTSITIPESVTSIDRNAFNECTGLTSITIPDGVTSIGENAFCKVPNIVYSGAASGSPWGAKALNGYIEDGLVYEDSSKTKLLACPVSREGAVVIPNSVTSIGNSAFSGCSSLTDVTIPYGVTSIDVRAFEDCSGLTSIAIPDSVTSLDDDAFSGCSSLTSVTIGSGVTSIGNHAFSECSSLKSVTIGNSVTSIGWGAFDNCYKLTEIYILNPDCISGESDGNIFSSTATIYSHAGYGVNKYAKQNRYSFVPIHINENTATAKCTEEVTEAKCKYCDEMTLPVLIHDFTVESTDEKYLCKAATCYRPASYYVSCTDCGLSSKGLLSEKTFSYGEAIEHKGKWVVSYPATCTSTGYENEYCIYCDCYLGGRTIPTTDHTGGDPVEENVIGATCTDPGSYDSVVYCAVCNKELSRTQKELPALGHDIVKYDAEDATCTTPGHKPYEVCTRCDYTTYEEIPALGHIEEVIPAVAANCVHTGLTEGKKCIRCKEILVEQQEIAKTAHTWDNGTVTKAPQIGVAGERTFTCTVCGATRTEEISPLVPSAPDRIEVKSSDSAKELTGGIVGATHSVTVSELLASSNASYIVDKDGNRITETTKSLATGMKIILESGGERLEKVISVLGDVNGDGEISVSDARGALRAAVGLDTLEGAYLNAARVNGANEVAVSDARSILRAAVALDTGKDWLANIK